MPVRWTRRAERRYILKYGRRVGTNRGESRGRMKMKRRRTAWVSLIFLAISAGFAFAQASQENSLDGKAAALQKHLQKKGFYVKEGSYAKLDFTQLYCAGRAESCNGNNFGAPYLAGQVPGLAAQAPNLCGAEGSADTFAPFAFRLRRDEAVVLVCTTPPPCQYYSYTTFLFYRWDPVRGVNRKIFSNIGEPLNRFVLKTGGKPFNKSIVIIYTPDEKTDKAVRAAAKAAGFADDVINTYVIPSSLLNTNSSLDATTDQLVIGQRMALFDDPTAGTNYVSNPGTHLYRVTPPCPASDADLKPMAAPNSRVRGTGTTESDLRPYVENLRTAIIGHYPQLQAQDLGTDQWIQQSPIALQTWANTLGDSSDAAYLATKQSFKLSADPNDFVIVYGVNHMKTKKALYSNINVYQTCMACGVASAFSNCNGDTTCVSFTGTATDYMTSGLPSDPDQLYALKIARDCTGDLHCLKVPVPNPPGSCGTGVDLDQDLYVAFRAYVEPKTDTGPSYTELQFDRVLHFTPVPFIITGLPVDPVEMPFPAPVTFTFSAPSSDDVTWQAQIEYIDNACCGTLMPDLGALPAGGGNASFTYTPVHPGNVYLTVTATDSAGRFCTRQVKFTSCVPPPDVPSCPTSKF